MKGNDDDVEEDDRFLVFFLVLGVMVEQIAFLQSVHCGYGYMSINPFFRV